MGIHQSQSPMVYCSFIFSYILFLFIKFVNDHRFFPARGTIFMAIKTFLKSGASVPPAKRKPSTDPMSTSKQVFTFFLQQFGWKQDGSPRNLQTCFIIFSPSHGSSCSKKSQPFNGAELPGMVPLRHVYPQRWW